MVVVLDDLLHQVSRNWHLPPVNITIVFLTIVHQLHFLVHECMYDVRMQALGADVGTLDLDRHYTPARPWQAATVIDNRDEVAIFQRFEDEPFI